MTLWAHVKKSECESECEDTNEHLTLFLITRTHTHTYTVSDLLNIDWFSAYQFLFYTLALTLTLSLCARFFNNIGSKMVHIKLISMLRLKDLTF